MRKLLCLIVSLALFAACDVHEWPRLPERVPFHLKLTFEKDMTVWQHAYDGTNVIEQGLSETYDNSREYGRIRYIIRAYPLSEGQRSVREHVQEFVFTKDIEKGYEHEVTCQLLPGDYSIMVWSDLVEDESKAPYYNVSDFAGISLQGEHVGNNDHRDAFCGTGNISLAASVSEAAPCTLEITMKRPLAKFEIITDDLAQFLEKQTLRLMAANAESEPATGDGTKTKARLEDYNVVFYYVGFMPDTYNMFTDKPVDSSTGITFPSSMKETEEGTVSLGFDHVFVNGKESAVTVQIGVYDHDGMQLSLTEPIDIPLKRSCHTVLRGSFLMSEASGGMGIDPGFNGNHNLIFP